MPVSYFEDSLYSGDNLELATRKSDGITVELSWFRTANLTAVHVSTPDDEFIIYPPNSRAWDCFNHPYAYAARYPEISV